MIIDNLQGKNTKDYVNQSLQDSFAYLEVNPVKGLSNIEALQRLEYFGANEINEKEEPLWHRIFRRFWGPIPWMIEVAAILSLLLQRWEEFIIISMMLLINAALDFFQEHKALSALKVLKQQVVSEVRVFRGAEYQFSLARELVPGDIIRLRIGDVIPADVQLLNGNFLAIDESSLTGESLPVTKSKATLPTAIQ